MGPRSPRVVYLAPGLFDFGGIARYGRYQLRAIRAVSDGKVLAASLLGPTDDAVFEDAVAVDFVAGGASRRQKLAFASRAIAWARPSAVVWCGHVHLAPLGLGTATAVRGACVVNIYGHEVWSSGRRVALAALGHAHVVADCHATAEDVVNRGLVRRDRMTVIWDPVDARFAPAERDPIVAERYGLHASSFTVMFLGRLSAAAAHKSPDGLIRAFGRARLPADAQLVLAGTGDRAEELRRLAEQSGGGKRVVFTGRVADADLPGLYRHASLFVLVSRKYDRGGEGLPLTPIEAAACGAPIVVGNEDGSREAVVDGETGFLVRSRDEGELVSILESAANDGARLRAMGAAAARDAAERFSYARFEREHRTFVERLVTERP